MEEKTIDGVRFWLLDEVVEVIGHQPGLKTLRILWPDGFLHYRTGAATEALFEDEPALVAYAQDIRERADLGVGESASQGGVCARPFSLGIFSGAWVKRFSSRELLRATGGDCV